MSGLGSLSYACHVLLASSVFLVACTSATTERSSAYHASRVATTGAVRRSATLLLHGDTRFGKREREVIERACLAWSEFTSGRARLQVIWDYGESNYMELAAASAPHIKRTAWWLSPPNVGGKVDAIGGSTVRLVPENCPSLYSCALHEFGHVLGLTHVPAASAVMSSTLKPSRPAMAFTDADRAECVRVDLCD